MNKKILLGVIVIAIVISAGIGIYALTLTSGIPTAGNGGTTTTTTTTTTTRSSTTTTTTTVPGLTSEQIQSAVKDLITFSPQISAANPVQSQDIEFSVDSGFTHTGNTYHGTGTITVTLEILSSILSLPGLGGQTTSITLSNELITTAGTQVFWSFVYSATNMFFPYYTGTITANSVLTSTDQSSLQMTLGTAQITCNTGMNSNVQVTLTIPITFTYVSA
jgi:hypothetical protein